MIETESDKKIEAEKTDTELQILSNWRKLVRLIQAVFQEGHLVKEFMW